MKIDIRNITDQGRSLAFEVAAGAFPVLKEMMDHGECRFSDPISVQVHAAPEKEMIRVKGEMVVNVALPCSRCLEFFEQKFSRRFTLRFSHEIPSDLVPAGAEEIELSAEQMDLMFFDGETIDLREAVQEQVVLTLPFKPLCREDCKGLCPHCGADLNSAACECKENTADNPFAILTNKKWPTR